MTILGMRASTSVLSGVGSAGGVAISLALRTMLFDKSGWQDLSAWT